MNAIHIIKNNLPNIPTDILQVVLSSLKQTITAYIDKGIDNLSTNEIMESIHLIDVYDDICDELESRGDIITIDESVFNSKQCMN